MRTLIKRNFFNNFAYRWWSLLNRYISKQQKHRLIFIYMVLFIYIFHIINRFDRLEQFHSTCLIKSKLLANNTDVFESMRGENYLKDRQLSAKCAFTLWELFHIIFHAYITYSYSAVVSLMTSITFEVYEQYHNRSGSYLDLVWNTVGLILGHTMYIILNKRRRKK